MILSYCKNCEYHSTVKILDDMHSRCQKENCLVIYSKCLTEKAVERLDIQTTSVSADGDQKLIPYAAVLYGLDGETWAYTNPEPLVYVRQNIVIDHIDGDMVVLSEGPDVDTPIVTVGVSLLYGAETGVSK